ncbi:hypothetical protein C9439_03815 [archaeon SCG-AAA382B04]|nr:hypothetical protein C9439_03815 [archaeon SCG-AAA382B04]
MNSDELKKQQPLIHEESWNYLIILDACRYDYFSAIHDSFLEGDLIKVESPATGTPNWLEKTFSSKFLEDVVYLSANPYVNSVDIEVADGFNAKNHFGEIIDLWDRCWKEDLKTVPPDEVVEGSLSHIENQQNKKYIIHFMQPHAPYLKLKTVGEGISGITRRAKGNTSLMIREYIGKLVESAFPSPTIDKIRKKLNLKKPGPEKLVAEKFGKDTLREAYKENLESVLKETKTLIRNLNGKIIITSDHGELLGEKDLYGHCGSNKNPILREVPWLEIVK